MSHPARDLPALQDHCRVSKIQSFSCIFSQMRASWPDTESSESPKDDTSSSRRLHTDFRARWNAFVTHLTSRCGTTPAHIAIAGPAELTSIVAWATDHQSGNLRPNSGTAAACPLLIRQSTSAGPPTPCLVAFASEVTIICIHVISPARQGWQIPPPPGARCFSASSSLLSFAETETIRSPFR